MESVARTSGNSGSVRLPPTTLEWDFDPDPGWDRDVAGTSSTLWVKTDGTLWSVGWNSHGVLGRGNVDGFNSTPDQVP